MKEFKTATLQGTIALNPKNNNLMINGDLRMQKGVKLRQSCIDEHNLQEGDRVIYGGEPYSTVFVFKKL